MLKKHYCFLLVSTINQHLPRSVLSLPLQPVELVYRTTECTWRLSGFIVPSPVPLKVLLLPPCVPTWNRSCHLPVTCSLESPVQTSILIHIQFKILFLHVVTSSGLACGLGTHFVAFGLHGFPIDSRTHPPRFILEPVSSRLCLERSSELVVWVAVS